MKIISKAITIAAVGMMTMTAMAAPEAEDLSAQREEKQTVNSVPGFKVDHKGLVINPTPVEINLTGGTLNITNGVQLKGSAKEFLSDLGFINQGGKTNLTIEYGAKKAASKGVKPITGSYKLMIGKNGITIVGYDARGAFYGIQTLRQIVKSDKAKGGSLPQLEIMDYPSMPDRGVVEGFYGTPWSHELRLSLIDFFGRNKLNVYIYGPKNDRYHNCPKWRLPYPEKEAAQLREVIEACKRNHVDFVWAIHPGQDYKWNEEDYALLIGKLNSMYDLGVRRFSVFFDDISGDGTNPVRQAELLNRITEEFVKVKPGVYPLTLCPSDYSELWAKPGPDGSLAIYGEKLNPEILIMWTGEAVCSDLTPSTLQFINTRTKRPAYFWWNFPVQDYMPAVILQGPVYGLDKTVTPADMSAFVSNPMEHGEASKLALYSVADYTWNIPAYNAIDSWERGLVEMAPEVADAYRCFAIHSSDTEMGYRRDESWETTLFTLDNWNDSLADALSREFRNVQKSATVLLNECRDTMLVKELRPWLIEFEKLGVRGEKVIDLARRFRAGMDDKEFWKEYTSLVMTPKQLADYAAHKSGTAKLQPFYISMMDDLGNAYLTKVSGKSQKEYGAIGTYESVNTASTKYMFDRDSTTYFTSRVIQQPGDWIGVDLKEVTPVSEIFILQGRNSRTCINYYDHSIIEYSLDGKDWKPLSDELRPKHRIHWKGSPVDARYLRLRRLDSNRQKYCFIRSFFVNPLNAGNIGFEITADNVEEAIAGFDKDLSTSWFLNGVMSFDVSPFGEKITLFMKPGAKGVVVTQLDADGKVIDSISACNPYTEVKIAGPSVKKIMIGGSAQIFEIL